jgi:DNA invertase Pin-like site-specific DNA recombinase
MKKAIAYVRVSTEAQATEGISLAAQSSKIAAWCHLNDCDLTRTYLDAGISGKRADNRPELQKAIDHVCKVGGVLVVYSLSRLARSTKDTLSIGDRLARSKADLVSLSEKIDTTSAAGKMVFRLFAVLAEFERDQISERVTAALDHKKKKGERRSRHIPYGYVLAADGIQLIANQQEQEVLDIVAQLHAEGLSMRAIATELNARGVPTKLGSPWKHSAIQRIIKRPSKKVA